MAAFNPDVKDVKPVNPIGWSKSADVPSSFASSLSEGIQGLGKLIGLGTTAADELVKQSAQNEAEKTFRPEVDKEISRLAGADFQLKLNQLSSATTNATNTQGVAPMSPGLGDNFVSPDNTLPAPLKELPKTLGILDGARANGHLSETAYLGRLTALAKDLRSQYPVGYRDYIDNQISKITGVDPANAYMKSLVGDINANLANTQAEKNKIASKILENIGSDPINGRDMYIGFTNGTKSKEQALDFIGRNEAIDVVYKRKTQEFQSTEQDKTLATTKAKEAFQEWSSGAVNSWIKGDLEKKGMSVQAIERLITDPNASKTITPERWVELATDVRQQMLTASSKIRDEFTKTGQDRPNSYAKLLGADGPKILENAIEPYTRILEAIEKKDTGLLFTTQRMVEAANTEMASKLFKDPSMKFFFGTMDAIRKHGGGDSAVTQFFARGLEGGFGTDWGNYLRVSKAELATPQRVPGETVKQVSNVSQFITETQSKENRLGIKTPESYKEVFSLVYSQDDRPSILNPSTPPKLKEAIAQNFFSDKTKGFLNKIQTDTIDDKGRKLDGRETMFRLFTSSRVVDQISQMSEPTKKAYYDWVQTSYEDVFKQGILDLANQPRVGESAAGNQRKVGAVVGWDDSNNKLVVNQGYLNEARQRAVRRGMPASGITDVELTVDKINSGIGGLVNVYTKQGLGPDAVQTKVMESLGLQIDQYRMVDNLPTQFRAALEEKYRKLQEEKAQERKDEAARKKAPK